MKSLEFSVVFMGNGPVACKSLEFMHKWANIEFVITKQRPAHHKDPAPVEEYCKKNNLPFFYANNKQELDACIELNKPVSVVGVVVDYGVIVSQKTINYFHKGIVNSHFSLLPNWRGADPITYSILSGQAQTGVSLMLIDAGLDTGPLLASKKLPINGQDNIKLTNELIIISDALLKEYLPKYINNSLNPNAQNTETNIVTYSRMLNKSDGNIETNKPASVLVREIKAFKQWPKSRLNYNGTTFIITEAVESDINIEQGRLAKQSNGLFLGCKKSCLEITKLKPAGKNEMTASAFINGYGHLINN